MAKDRTRTSHGISRLAGCTLMLAATAASARAQTPEEFYKGRTIELVIGFTPAGGYDVYARLVARHMAGHMPGKPSLVAKQMTGGGSRIAANYIYNIAARDGTVIATADQSLPLQQVLGDATIKFDTARLSFIGNPIVDNNTLVSWHTTGLTRWEQARDKAWSLGATGPNTSAWYGQAMNEMLATRFKIIMGYPGGADINLALEKGEVDLRGSNSWSSWKATRPDWIADKKLNILVQIGLGKDPELATVPLLMDLPADADEKAALKVLSAPTTIGRPLFAPPGVPPDRIQALRAAFDATMQDPAFLAEAKTAKLDLQPLSGEAMQRIVADIVATPPRVAERLKTVLGQTK